MEEREIENKFSDKNMYILPFVGGLGVLKFGISIRSDFFLHEPSAVDVKNLVDWMMMILYKNTSSYFSFS